MRAGTGYDSHRFTDTRPLVLGGIVVPGAPGLAGHSDGDALLHALTDALLGAAALGSIGELFPDTDDRYAGADSAEMLQRVVEGLADEGWRVVNVDATVVAERPRIRPHVVRMRERIAGLLRCPGDAVSIKGKTNEGLGWIGRREGLAVHAIAMIERID